MWLISLRAGISSLEIFLDIKKFLYEASAVSSSLASSKCSRFRSRNDNLKGGKNSEYSVNQDFTEKLRPLRKTFFSPSVHSYEEKLTL